MKLTKIDMENWDRKKIYEHYMTDVPCTYSMSVNVNISKLLSQIKKENINFFPVILFCISSIINKHNEFRMQVDEQGNLGFYDYLNPSYALFHAENELFTTVWTEFNTEFTHFYLNYNIDMEKYKNDRENSKPTTAKNIFNVSCIPWVSFTGFNLNLQKGYDYLAPIFTIGKYFLSENTILLPIAIQVHHAVCDAFHVARFVNELQECLDSFSL